MTRRRVVLGAVLLALAMAGCSNADQPEEAVWGKQPCAHCKMVLSEPRHAAQGVTSGGERLHFDDLGCMLEYQRKQRAVLARAWVKSAEGAWIDARSARYAPGARTPMDYGYASNPAGELTLGDVERRIAARAGARP